MEQWANFYVIASAAAATLLGLLFVVIALAAERGHKDLLAIRIYLTPAVIYFSSVLLKGALLTVPNQTRHSAAICICLLGIVGLGYSGSLAIGRGAGRPSTHTVPTFSPTPFFRSPHMLLWSLVVSYSFEEPKSASTW